MNQPESALPGSTPECEPAPLSPAGQARRDRMLAVVMPAVHARRRRRRAAAAAAAAAPVLLVGVLVWVLHPTQPQGSPEPHGNPAAHASPAASEAEAFLASMVIRDRPELLKQAIVRGDASSIERISDDELLALLEEAGEPSGLIRTRGTALTAADVRGGAEPGMEPSGRLPDAPSPSLDGGPAWRTELAAAYSRR